MDTRLSLLIALLFLVSACTQAGRDHPVQAIYGSEVPRSKISKEHQIIISFNAGQRISVPTQKTDLGILWAAPGDLKGNAHYSKLLSNSQLSSNAVGEISQLEALLASHYLDQLLRKNKAISEKVAKRAVHYIPYIVAELEKRGLPIELAALPMVESAYISNAVSHAGAAGLWQIMPLTGKDLGLEIGNNNDERFHFEKSTQAALDYLTALYKKFNDWPLAISAYNCGAGRLERALEVSKTNNLVDLLNYCKRVPAHKNPLHAETQRYVPQFIAASIYLKEIGVLPNNTAVFDTIRANATGANAIGKIDKTTNLPQKPLQLKGNYDIPSTAASQQPLSLQSPSKMTRVWQAKPPL